MQSAGYYSKNQYRNKQPYRAVDNKVAVAEIIYQPDHRTRSPYISELIRHQHHSGIPREEKRHKKHKRRCKPRISGHKADNARVQGLSTPLATNSECDNLACACVKKNIYTGINQRKEPARHQCQYRYGKLIDQTAVAVVP